MPKSFFLPHEVAELMGVHRTTVASWAKTGEIRFSTIPKSGQIRISAEEVKRIMTLHGIPVPEEILEQTN